MCIYIHTYGYVHKCVYVMCMWRVRKRARERERERERDPKITDGNHPIVTPLLCRVTTPPALRRSLRCRSCQPGSGLLRRRSAAARDLNPFMAQAGPGKAHPGKAHEFLMVFAKKLPWYLGREINWGIDMDWNFHGSFTLCLFNMENCPFLDDSWLTCKNGDCP